jgi:hypothetical protein
MPLRGGDRKNNYFSEIFVGVGENYGIFVGG